MENLLCLLSDRFVFPAFQFCFTLLAAYAWAKDRGFFLRKGSVSLTVKRGEESWNRLNLAYGVLAIVFLQTIDTTDTCKGYKTLLMIFDLSVLLYLCFFNSWFRNKTIGIVTASKELAER